jgi:pimeloyl-ACP methyl ester carboxylesterase
LSDPRYAVNGEVRIASEPVGERGTWLVLVHGLGYDRRGWGPLVELLAQRWRVVLVDSRGIGDSDVPRGPYTVSQMAADVAAVIAEVSPAPVHVLGTSLGGMVALELAISRPELIDRLVLLSTTPGGPDSYRPRQETIDLLLRAKRMPREEVIRGFVDLAIGTRLDGRRGEVVEAVTAHRLARVQTAAPWRAQVAAATLFRCWERLPRIVAPTLVLHGEADRIVDPRNLGP